MFDSPDANSNYSDSVTENRRLVHQQNNCTTVAKSRKQASIQQAACHQRDLFKINKLIAWRCFCGGSFARYRRITKMLRALLVRMVSAQGSELQ
jgi:hypothetical protein